jgi:glycolate oxidase iron-sulfur subunit
MLNLSPTSPNITLAELAPEPAVPGLKLDPRTYDQALACVHCGLCLPACPTYLQTGHEAESPRGRIHLMRGISDGTISPTAKVTEHLDSCLDCRGCETACPSGVVYHELIEETRDRVEQYLRRRPAARQSLDPLVRWFLRSVLSNPRAVKLAVLPVRLLQRAHLYDFLRRLRVLELLPQPLQQMERMLPESGPLWPKPLPQMSGATGIDALVTTLRNYASSRSNGDPKSVKPRLMVGFFAGCVGSIVYDQVNRQAIQLLMSCGADVYAPSQQGCCGAIHQHGGAADEAREMARRVIDLFLPTHDKGVDYLVTNIAGCGAMLHEYDVLLRDDPVYSGRARELCRKVRDITQLLCELPLPPMIHPVNLTVTYHDACHLAHAQKLATLPRQLLGRIPGLKIIPLAESDLCCGAAGTYNLTHPKMAGELADRKLSNIAASGAPICVAGNAGCALHLQSQARQRGQQLRIVHPVELIYQSVFGCETTEHGPTAPSIQGAETICL